MEKIRTLRQLIQAHDGDMVYDQYAIAALEGISNSRDELTLPRFQTIVSSDRRLQEFTKRRKDQVYHETNRRELKDLRESQVPYDQLFLEKLDIGKKGWAKAKRQVDLSGMSVEEQFKLLESFFPDPSNVRDEILEEITAGLRLSFKEYVQVIGKFESPIKRIQFGKAAFNRLRRSEPEHFANFERAKESVLELFPDYSLERDRQLSQLTEDYETDYQQTISLDKLYIEGNEQYSTDESVIFAMAGMETFRDYVRLALPQDKIDIVLWLLNLSVKPPIIDIMEQSSGYKLSAMKDLLKDSGDAENKIFLQELFLGHNGIFSSGTDKERDYFLDRVFTMIVPDSHPMEKGARLKMHTLFRAIFRFATPKRQTDLIVSLFNARNQKFTLAQMIRVFLQSYGPLGIKVGQYLALRTNFLPEDIREELLNFFDKADPILKSQFYETVRVVYDVDNPDKVFPKIGKRLGSASFKQVHEAEILDEGRLKKATVKVVRPAALKEILSDLQSFDALIRYINAEQAFFGFTLPKDMGKELRRRVFEEMDFKGEAGRQEKMRINMQRRWATQGRQNGLLAEVPQVYSQYTRTKAFVDREAPGVPLTSANIPQRFSKEDISKTIVQEVLDEIFIDGFYHGDPHPGNIFISEDGTLYFIDFGITGILSTLNRDRLFDLVEYIMTDNKEGVSNLILEFYAQMDEKDRPRITMEDIQKQVENIFSQSFDPKEIGKSLYRSLDAINRLGIQLPDEWYALLGTLTEMDYWLANIKDVPMFIFPLLMKYKEHHDTEKKNHPIDRISSAKLDELREILKNGTIEVPQITTKPRRAKKSTVAKPETKGFEEIWKVDRLKAGTKIRFKGQEDEWKVTFDTDKLKTGVSVILQKHSDATVQEHMIFLEKRGKAVMDKWILSRLPTFPNDGEEFSVYEDRNRSGAYIAHLRQQGNKAAQRAHSIDDIELFHQYYENLEVYHLNEAWAKFLEGQKVFEDYLFNGLGISKDAVAETTDGIRGIYENIYKEIDKDHVIHKVIYLTEETIGNLQVLNDDKWEDFNDFRLTKGMEDHAIVATRGGIDFTASKMNLQTKMDSRLRENDNRESGNDRGIRFHLDPAVLAELQNAPGFVPVIINIRPMIDLKAFFDLEKTG